MKSDDDEGIMRIMEMQLRRGDVEEEGGKTKENDDVEGRAIPKRFKDSDIRIRGELDKEKQESRSKRLPWGASDVCLVLESRTAHSKVRRLLQHRHILA